MNWMNIFSLAPELIVIATAFLILIFDLFISEKQKSKLLIFSLVGLAFSAYTCISLFDLVSTQPLQLMGGRFEITRLDLWFKIAFISATFLTLTLCSSTFDENKNDFIPMRSEFLITLLFSLSGMLFLVSARDLVNLYVSLELATIPLIALTAWKRSSTSGEAGIKYLVIAALSSALLLYGLGWVYGLAGTMNLNELSVTFKGLSSENHAPLIFASILLLAGVGFKLTLFPFHMWSPDVYEGAPSTVTAYLSVASKATGLVLAFQIFYRIFGSHLSEWSLAIAWIACLTMTLGNVVAVLQNNLKRFMAFSAISQAGYLIMGFLGNQPTDASPMVFYMLIYIFTNLCAFSVILLITNQTPGVDIQDLKGLSKTNPLLALCMMIALFGLAGIPPLSGFVGKFFLFNTAAKKGYFWLILVAAVNSTISLYYYLRLIRQMYIEQAPANWGGLKVSPLTRLGLLISCLGSVFIGLIPFFYERITHDTVSWFASVASLN